MKESQNMPVSLRKLVLLSNNGIVCRHCLHWMAQAQQHYKPCKKECNKYELIAAQFFLIGPSR
jgi:hypothetical protein